MLGLPKPNSVHGARHVWRHAAWCFGAHCCEPRKVIVQEQIICKNKSVGLVLIMATEDIRSVLGVDP